MEDKNKCPYCSCPDHKPAPQMRGDFTCLACGHYYVVGGLPVLHDVTISEWLERFPKSWLARSRRF